METLKQGLKAFGIEPRDETIALFSQYEKLLLQWNEKMNLTAITDHEEILKKHFVDSIALSAYIPQGASLADVGTGAGFPGVPLRIVREDISVDLMDALQKRVTFLETVTDTLGLSGTKALHLRAEDAGQSPLYREQYDVVTARAVANLTVLCEYCLPLVKCGGVFLAMKGREGREEVKNAENAIKILGGECLEIRDTFWEETEHCVVVVQKKRHTPSKYPRKAGKPQKSPIL